MNIIEQTEKDFAKYIGTKYAMLLNSGTSALYCAYRAINIKDKEVIVPAFTYYATANMVLAAGGIPVFADIRSNCLIDFEKVEKLITKKTAAVVLVNLFGEEYLFPHSFATHLKKKRIKLIVDAAQCCKPGINYGDIQCFSFYRTKNFSCFEGGAVTTNDKKLMKKMYIVSHQGEDTKYNTVDLGFNFRISDLQAVMLQHQLNYHFIGGKAELGRFTPKNGHYPRVVYEQPYYKELGYYKKYKGTCPVAEGLAKEVREKYWK